ncbi:MAG: tRNA guanosine(34) transglycosylase Tgt [Candidatus Saccharibacteria bacterium]|nr:tRNA guanosine(34) transglycosylase Tgt [Candidatus Saccharibacteria bacterium]
MSKIFSETHTFGKFGRTGVLHTRAGDVLTPTFMPDGTRGAVKGLTPEQVAGTGVGIVLANTYHLHLAPGEAVIKNLGGLHKFANRKGPMLTDSGGFQVFSLGQHVKITEDGVHFKDPKTGDKQFISPEKSIQIQLDLGADMIVAFDHLVGLDHTVTDRHVKEAFDRTHRWLERCIVEFKRLTKDMKEFERPLLFGVVQGGLDIELRKESLRIIQASDVDGIAIGGLSVGETREEMAIVLKALAPIYDPKRPRFLLGVGTPEDLKIAVENGIDMLDCVLPTRNARHGSVWGKDSIKMTLTNEQFKEDSLPIDPDCDCYTCANGFSRAFLRHQYKSGEPLAGTLASIHNLRHMMRLCENYKINKSVIRFD